MTIRHGFPIGFLILVCFPLAGMAQVYFTKTGHAQFTSHSTLEDFTGQSDYMTGKINLADSTVDFYLDLSTLYTGIGLRDEHMHEDYLQVNKYPFASFYGKLTNALDPATTDTQKVTVQGKFKIHGVSRQVEIDGYLLKRGEELYVNAHWPLQLQNYDIEIPSFLFLRVNRTINVSIKALLRKQNGS